MLKPLPQHPRDSGPFVQDGSGALLDEVEEDTVEEAAVEEAGAEEELIEDDFTEELVEEGFVEVELAAEDVVVARRISPSASRGILTA